MTIVLSLDFLRRNHARDGRLVVVGLLLELLRILLLWWLWHGHLLATRGLLDLYRHLLLVHHLILHQSITLASQGLTSQRVHVLQLPLAFEVHLPLLVAVEVQMLLTSEEVLLAHQLLLTIFQRVLRDQPFMALLPIVLSQELLDVLLRVFIEMLLVLALVAWVEEHLATLLEPSRVLEVCAEYCNL